MVCPRKNDPRYKALVKEHGEVKAYHIWSTQSDGLSFPQDNIRTEIQKLLPNINQSFDLYKSKYQQGFPKNIELTPLSLAIYLADYQRVHGAMPISGVTDTPAYTQGVFENTLERLAHKFEVPFSIINDPKIKDKGWYQNVDGKKEVVINVAHASPDTPFHEYYHAPVRILKEYHPNLYANLVNEAESVTNKAIDEEGLVDLLGKMAANKRPTNLLNKFINYIKSLFKASPNIVNLKASTSLSEFVNYLTSDAPIDVSKEQSILRAYQTTDVAKAIEGKFQDAVTPSNIDYIGELKKQAEGLIADDDSVYYKDDAGNIVGARLTPFVGDRELGVFSTRFKNRAVPSYEEKAERQFAQAGLRADEKIIIKNGQLALTLAEYAQYLKAVDARNRLIGKMQHAYIAFLTEEVPAVAAQRKLEAEAYAAALGEEFESISKHPYLKVIDEDFHRIMSLAGVNKYDTQVLAELKDRLAPELTIKSGILTDTQGKPLITTADGLVQHYNNELSLIDYKTGDIISDIDVGALMEYGKEFGITDSKLNKGYLELAFRALMIKEKFPDARFRGVRIVRIDNKDGRHKAFEVDLEPYLGMIGAYYKANNKDVYNALVEKNLLDETTYVGVQTPIIKYSKVLKDLTLHDRLVWVDNKLAELTLNRSKETLEADSSEIKAQRAALAELRLELTKQPGTNLKGQFDDIDRFFGQIKNMSDIEHAGFQTFHVSLLDAKNKAREQFEDYAKQEALLLKDVLTEVGQDPASSSLLSKIIKTGAVSTFMLGTATGNPLVIGASVLFNLIGNRLKKAPKDVFKFLWSESTDTLNPGFFLNTEDYYFVDGNKVFMSKAQLDYRNFIQSSMATQWKETMSRVSHYDRRGRPITKAEALGYPPDLPTTFMPRIPKPVDELRLEQEVTQGFFGIQTRLKSYAQKSLSRFVEDTYYSEDKGGIPVKFYKHNGSMAVQDGGFSFNAHEAYRNFMGNLINKQHLDPIYTLGEGLKNIVELEKDEAGRLKYPNFAKFIDNQIYLQVLNRSKEVTATKSLLTIPPNKFLGNQNDLIINQDKVLRSLKGGVSFSVMAFKMVAATANASLITIVNTMNATKQPIAALMGLPPEDVGITSLGAAKAYGSYSAHLAATFQGKESKLMNLAKKFDWLPDNYDYQNRKEDLLYDVTSKGLGHYGYLFHNYVETYGGLVHLGMMMQSMKVTVNGKKTTLWDAYNEEGEWTGGVRGKVEVSPGEFKELKELDTLEIKNLKRAYEKLHGSYRKEERTQIEVSVIGEFILQFKKFFYTYMKNLYASPHNDITTGQYVLRNDISRPDGVPVWKWESEVMQGRINVLVAGFVSASILDKITLGLTNKAYYGTKGSRTPQQVSRVKRVVELANTALWMLMMYAAYALALDDDEESTAYAFRFRRLVEDTSMGLNPKDLFSTIEKPVVAADRISRLGKAFIDYAAGGETKEGRRKGERQLVANIPIASNVQQLVDMFTSKKHVTEGMFFGLVPLERTDLTR